MYAVIDGMLERISNLISELDHRLQDGSILNADVPAYVRRLNASIQNLYRVLPHVRNQDRRGYERIMLWLSTLRITLRSEPWMTVHFRVTHHPECTG